MCVECSLKMCPWKDKKGASVTLWMDGVWDEVFAWKETLLLCVQERRKILSRCQTFTWGEFSESRNTALGQAEDSAKLFPVIRAEVMGHITEGRPFSALNQAYFQGMNFLQRWNCFWQKMGLTWEVMRKRTLFIFPPYDLSQGYSLTWLRTIPRRLSLLSPVLTGYCCSWQIYIRFLASHTLN